MGIIIKACEAELAGVSLKDTPAEYPISFDEEHNVIMGLGEFSTAKYSVPEGLVSGEYDIYLEISKASNAFVSGSTPLYVSVNGGKKFVPSINVQPCTMGQMGMGRPATYMTVTGLFQIREGISLQAGDDITVGGIGGSEFYFGGNYANSLPAIGAMHIFPAGTEVVQGYEGSTFIKKHEKKDTKDPLSGLKIGWLGSSVTYGQAGDGYSMADAIADNHKATSCDKYAISGTTLASRRTAASLPSDGEGSHGSYVERVKLIDTDIKYDLFIIQLSTNDASNGIPMGQLSAGKEYEGFDKSTVIGAMEHIVKYVKDTWKCPVMFYSGSRFNSQQYPEMVEAMLAIKDKWDIGVIDLWNNDEVNNISDELRATYIREDGIHPLREGYEKWWAPAFEKGIKEYLTQC